MRKLSRAVGTNLPTRNIVELQKELGRGMSEIQMAGRFTKEFLTQQSRRDEEPLQGSWDEFTYSQDSRNY